jgi:hypothetical protein
MSARPRSARKLAIIVHGPRLTIHGYRHVVQNTTRNRENAR